ncbi:hypothetical protein BGZ60DRAFT_429954 [Tricladium varicosporioides]|nr:hypothetical protein BGZ60DRAFT_429954 [Hymenoscyphus varicosporioides]
MASTTLSNMPALGAPYYTPIQAIPSGTAIDPSHASHPSTTTPSPLPKLFTPLTLRSLTLQNRIIVSPMCQYSAHNGHHTPWHTTHYGSMLSRGPGLTIIEATAVCPEGRISPQDSGLWMDSQIEPLRKTVEFAHSQGQKIAIQLGHAGRKASTVAPWIDRKAAATKDADGWPDEVVSVSNVPFDENTCIPKTMTLEDIEKFKENFGAAVKRAVIAGFDAIEIHAAHGYLLHSFLSPATNTLPAPYGGTPANRHRIVLELITLTRSIIPSTMPLLIRIPGTDWAPSHYPTESFKVEDAVALAKALVDNGGVDLIDVSSAGLISEQKITSGPGYQAPFAKAVKAAVAGSDIVVTSVGMISSGTLAEKLILDGSCDAVMVARGFLKNPGLVWAWAEELGVEVRVAEQFGWGYGQRGEGGVAKREMSARG